MPLINNIPERYESGFNELAIITEEQFSKIRNGISAASITYSLEKLALQLESIEGLEGVDIEDILYSVSSIVPYLEKEEMIDEIVKDIVTISTNNEEIFIEDEAEFSERLTFLLKDTHIYYASKATDLISNYSNLFILSRIITDIRPVFSLNIEESPSSGVIIHTLNIHYQSNEEPYHKDISITLNKEDLITLKESIIRAEKKQESLQGIFDKASIQNLTQ
jgi:hypothetical protein